ncbi:MAG: substrate-binding domain-containing protein [Pseudomonadota bacterium]
MIRIFAVLAVLFHACAVQADVVRLAVTTSFQNSGLADVLLPQVEADLAIDVQLLVVGTGQALRLGRSGDVDAILVHARTAEQAFVAEGHGTHRREIMYNDFVLVGPAGDPAGAGAARTAVAALQAIAAAGADFVSRGDDSGTHMREQSLWEMAGGVPEGRWYKSVGAGMGAALNTASGLGGYILSDRASWLNFRNKGGLALLFDGDPMLFNQYAFLPVNAERHAHVNADAVARLEAWLTSEAARVVINGYRVDGEQLFTFNAAPEG